MDDLTRERYGPVLPSAERKRAPWWLHGDGRPDTPEKITQRRRDLAKALRGAPRCPTSHRTVAA